MGKHNCPFLILLTLFWLTACSGGDPFVRNDGPRLLEDVTLAPVTATDRAVRAEPQTPTVVPTQLPTTTPLPVVTIRSTNVVFTTPTLPPSKTPTLTPTSLPTVTPTPLPTTTPYTIISIGGGSPAAFIASTPGALTPAGVAPVPQSCAVPWFFAQPVLPVCPNNAAATSAASYLQFQNGFMFWVGQLDAIYVLYSDGVQPRWQVFQDNFVDGMPETDPAYDAAPAGTWQPRRGFGLVWREQTGVRDRLGWSAMDGEAAYTIQLQTGQDGSVMLTDPRGLIFQLEANGGGWTRYGG